jgi:uncharacterized protein (AIM24 family)
VDNDTLIADQGLFFCAEDSLKVEAHKVESFSARVAGGEGRYQTKITGTGIVVFRIPVPRKEILEFTLTGDTMQVDGSMALLRSGSVQFSVEKASTSIVGAVTSGEGLLQTFRGSGKVWVAPTQPFYGGMGLASVSV